MEEMERLIDIEDVATYLKLQKQTIYNWLRQGKLTGIKMGHVWRFRRSDIDEWLKSHFRKGVKNE